MSNLLDASGQVWHGCAGDVKQVPQDVLGWLGFAGPTLATAGTFVSLFDSKQHQCPTWSRSTAAHACRPLCEMHCWPPRKRAGADPWDGLAHTAWCASRACKEQESEREWEWMGEEEKKIRGKGRGRRWETIEPKDEVERHKMRKSHDANVLMRAWFFFCLFLFLFFFKSFLGIPPAHVVLPFFFTPPYCLYSLFFFFFFFQVSNLLVVNLQRLERVERQQNVANIGLLSWPQFRRSRWTRNGMKAKR